MRFKEDIIVEFVKSQKRAIVDKSSHISWNGYTLIKIKTSNGEVWRFLGGTEVSICGLGARGEEYRRPAKSQVATRKWREFAIDQVTGFQRDSMIGKFIQDAREEFLDKIEELCESETLCNKCKTLGNEELEHLLRLEEKKFAVGLASCKSDFDFRIVRQGVRVNRAFYGSEVNSRIQYLLNFVDRDIVHGDKVYSFTDVQKQHYERLNELLGKIDFVMRYQIYRADQKEAKTEQVEQ